MGRKEHINVLAMVGACVTMPCLCRVGVGVRGGHEATDRELAHTPRAHVAQKHSMACSGQKILA